MNISLVWAAVADMFDSRMPHFGLHARETQADWIMLRPIELHVYRGGQILLISRQ